MGGAHHVVGLAREDGRRWTSPYRRCMIVLPLLVACLGCSGNEHQAVPAPPAPAAAEALVVGDAATVLMPAPVLGEIDLVDQEGARVRFEALRDRPVLLTFIYTRCPMPEMCPATTLRFRQVQDQLSAEDRSRVRLVAVSFDPVHDTPAVLAEYADLWDVDSKLWTLLTGAEEDIRALAAAHGTWFERGEDGNYRHPMYSMILHRGGALHRVLLGSAWDANEVAGVLVALASPAE